MEKGDSNTATSTAMIATFAADKTNVSGGPTEWHTSGNSTRRTHTYVPHAEGVNLLSVFRNEVLSVMLSVAVLGTLVNGAVMLLLMRPGIVLPMRTYLQLCLAGSSLLLSSASCPIYIAAVFAGRWPFSRAGCVWYAVSFRLIGSITNYTLAAMAFER